MTAGRSSARTSDRLWREVADRVYLRRFAEINVSVGLVVGEASSLVIDTRASERQGRELVRQVRRLTRNALVVANTHHHYDHAFGNHAFLPSDIWGQERCALRLREDGRTVQLSLAGSMPEGAAEYLETTIAPHNKTFRESVELDLGSRQVKLMHLGRGHTDNDVIVLVPDARVLFVGDLVEQGGPPSFEDSYPLDWPGTLGRMLDHVEGPVVPGHGEVVDRAFVEGQLADLSALAELARRVRFDGGSVIDALPVSPFAGNAGRYAMTRAFAQLEGEL